MKTTNQIKSNDAKHFCLHDTIDDVDDDDDNDDHHER